VVAGLREAGLEPGLPDGGYLQAVPIRAFRYGAALTFRGTGRDIALTAPEAFIAWPGLDELPVELREVPVVFAGYGIVAPEYGWDDYGGVDVRGALVLLLPGDPPLGDGRRFEGTKVSPYAARASKLRTARARGAAAVLVIDAPSLGEGPYAGIAREWADERMTLATPAIANGSLFIRTAPGCIASARTRSRGDECRRAVPCTRRLPWSRIATRDHDPLALQPFVADLLRTSI
jgi:hypothetical protein